APAILRSGPASRSTYNDIGTDMANRPALIWESANESQIWRFGIATQLWYMIVMNRDEAMSRLKQHEADLKRLGVKRLYMFGSTARGDAKEDSDVDLFFDYEKGKLGLFELMDVKEYAASILGRKADIMTRDSLHKMLREKIESTAVRVFYWWPVRSFLV